MEGISHDKKRSIHEIVGIYICRVVCTLKFKHLEISRRAFLCLKQKIKSIFAMKSVYNLLPVLSSQMKN